MKEKYLLRFTGDGMLLLTTHQHKQMSVNGTPTVFNSEHIRIICLSERYGFSSQCEQLMWWETWSALEREKYLPDAQGCNSTFYNTEGKKWKHSRVLKSFGLHGNCEVMSNMKDWREDVYETSQTSIIRTSASAEQVYRLNLQRGAADGELQELSALLCFTVSAEYPQGKVQPSTVRIFPVKSLSTRAETIFTFIGGA